MTMRDIWQLLAGEGRRRIGETLREWSDRLRKLVPPPAISDKDHALAERAPRCEICGAVVFLSEYGRFDIRHDRGAHRVGTGWSRDERKPVTTSEKIGDAVKSVMRRRAS